MCMYMYMYTYICMYIYIYVVLCSTCSSCRSCSSCSSSGNVLCCFSMVNTYFSTVLAPETHHACSEGKVVMHVATGVGPVE